MRANGSRRPVEGRGGRGSQASSFPGDDALAHLDDSANEPPIDACRQYVETNETRRVMLGAPWGVGSAGGPADEIAHLADLRNRGTIDDAESQRLKAPRSSACKGVPTTHISSVSRTSCASRWRSRGRREET